MSALELSKLSIEASSPTSSVHKFSPAAEKDGYRWSTPPSLSDMSRQYSSASMQPDSSVDTGASAIGSERSFKGSGELNPKVSVFTPVGDLKTAMPDLSSLRIADWVSVSSNEGTMVIPPYGQADSQPALTQSSGGKSVFSSGSLPQTPALTSSSGRSYSQATPGSNHLSPMTPATHHGQSSGAPSLPQTPYTPYSSQLWKAQQNNKNLTVEHDLYVKDAGSAEQLGRYLAIREIPVGVDAKQMQRLIQTIADHKLIIVKFLDKHRMVMVAFYDPREAEKVYRALQNNTVAFYAGGEHVSLLCVKVEESLVQSFAEGEKGWEALWEDRESRVVTEVAGGRPVALENMKTLLQSFGDVERLQEIGRNNTNFIVYYWDTRDASAAVQKLNGWRNGDTVLHVYLYEATKSSAPIVRPTHKPTLGAAAHGGSISTRLFANGSRASYETAASATDPFNAPLPYVTAKTHDLYAPRFSLNLQTGPSAEALHAVAKRPQMPVFDAPATPAPSAWGGSHLGTQARWGFNRQRIPKENLVYPDRILNDARTTVMVKDVPNKLARQELVDILAEVVPCEFDFVYLRFDFKNRCNVGYAFVNFMSASALLRFHEARVGRKWNMFSSEKVLQISYADIQGKQALIAKFKNSQVMDQNEEWRPQIFHGPLKGQPEPFPQPDSLIIRQRAQQEQYGIVAQPWLPRNAGSGHYNYAESFLHGGYTL